MTQSSANACSARVRAVLGPVISGIAAVLLAAVWLALPSRAADLRLIMVDDPNCSYCRKWDAEVGRDYSGSREAARAPLVRVRRGDPALQAFKVAAYTPTFILAGPQGEVGRIVGYPGRQYFWSELGELIALAGEAPGKPPASPRAGREDFKTLAGGR